MRIGEYLGGIDYPGRIILGGTGAGGEDILLYAITGRSDNSRNRLFALDGGTLRTIPADASKVADPSLIIYRAMASACGSTVLTNGDQTDTICSFLSAGGTLGEALASREYEPDAPNYTPRISLVMGREGYSLSIISKESGSDEASRRIFDYGKENGACHIIHTYEGNGDPLPSFSGLPVRLEAEASALDLLSRAWDALDPDIRISMYVRYGSDEIVRNAMGGTNG